METMLQNSSKQMLICGTHTIWTMKTKNWVISLKTHPIQTSSKGCAHGFQVSTSNFDFCFSKSHISIIVLYNIICLCWFYSSSIIYYIVTYSWLRKHFSLLSGLFEVKLLGNFCMIVIYWIIVFISKKHIENIFLIFVAKFQNINVLYTYHTCAVISQFLYFFADFLKRILRNMRTSFNALLFS